MKTKLGVQKEDQLTPKEGIGIQEGVQKEDQKEDQLTPKGGIGIKDGVSLVSRFKETVRPSTRKKLETFIINVTRIDTAYLKRDDEGKWIGCSPDEVEVEKARVYDDNKPKPNAYYLWKNSNNLPKRVIANGYNWVADFGKSRKAVMTVSENGEFTNLDSMQWAEKTNAEIFADAGTIVNAQGIELD